MNMNIRRLALGTGITFFIVASWFASFGGWSRPSGEVAGLSHARQAQIRAARGTPEHREWKDGVAAAVRDIGNGNFAVASVRIATLKNNAFSDSRSIALLSGSIQERRGNVALAYQNYREYFLDERGLIQGGQKRNLYRFMTLAEQMGDENVAILVRNHLAKETWSGAAELLMFKSEDSEQAKDALALVGLTPEAIETTDSDVELAQYAAETAPEFAYASYVYANVANDRGFYLDAVEAARRAKALAQNARLPRLERASESAIKDAEMHLRWGEGLPRRDSARPPNLGWITISESGRDGFDHASVNHN